jgi:hypothetical protein
MHRDLKSRAGPVLKHTWFGKQPRCILYRGLLRIWDDRLLTKLYLICSEYFKKRRFVSWIGSKSFKYNIPTQRNLRYSSTCTCKGTRCFGIQPSHIFSPRNWSIKNEISTPSNYWAWFARIRFDNRAAGVYLKIRKKEHRDKSGIWDRFGVGSPLLHLHDLAGGLVLSYVFTEGIFVLVWGV